MNRSNPLWLALASLVIPGSGHIYRGQLGVGLAQFLLYLTAWFWALNAPRALFPWVVVVGVAMTSAAWSFFRLSPAPQPPADAEKLEQALTPIPVERFARELEEMSRQKMSGQLSEQMYDQRLARAIAELRNRKIAGDREEIERSLRDLEERSVITREDAEHLIRRLGL